MKQYLLFAGYEYYPAGGWDDFKGDFDTTVEAIQALAAMEYRGDWWQIIDRDTKEEINLSALPPREVNLIAEMNNRS